MPNTLDNFVKTHDYLICVDSDGCLLDNMELKHKECFCPATVNIWDLQAVSKYARQCAEFVNLYSRSRGWNRFPALVRTLDLLFEREEVKRVGLEKPELSSLRDWISNTKSLSVPALMRFVEESKTKDESMLRAARWSTEVDNNIAHIVRNIRPFPGVKDALTALRKVADIVVVSATPNEALFRELTACGIVDLVSCVAGQESGTKSESIHKAMQGRYDADHVLKVGDAASDFQAAKDNHVLFYPIIPGTETESWEKLGTEILHSFPAGEYKGTAMDKRVEQFLNALPEEPNW